MTYSLAVIGGGPGGYTAAEKAAAAGMDVILFEKNEPGGVCLHEGCIPTKALLHCAKTYDHARHGAAFGLVCPEPQFDFAKMMERKKRVVRRLAGGVKAGLREAGVTCIKECAVIVGRNAGGLFTVRAGEECYEAERLLIATGSSAVVPPIPGITESDAVVTSTGLLSLTEVPQSLAVIGGGVIGMEFAALMSTLGAKVSVIEMLPEILAGFDTETAAALRACYASRGVEFHLSCRVSSIDGNTIVFTDSEGTENRICAEKILVSTGRRPNTEGLGLENLGVETRRGIVTDGRMRTSVPGIWAVGDVNGRSMLAHTAIREAGVAVSDMLGKEDTMEYGAIPGVVYTCPEVAGIGLTEENAPADAVIKKLPIAFSGRYVAENEDISGFCKLICDGKSEKILGAWIVGNSAGEIIHSIALAMASSLSASDLRRTVFPHPTVSEILQETIA